MMLTVDLGVRSAGRCFQIGFGVQSRKSILLRDRLDRRSGCAEAAGE